MNTAIEFDLGGNINSTHVMGKTMMNGIGGSGDFTRNAYLSIFCYRRPPRAARSPQSCSGLARTCLKHSVQIVVTEQSVADLRGKDPHERAELIIRNCVHPDYKEPTS